MYTRMLSEFVTFISTGSKQVLALPVSTIT